MAHTSQLITEGNWGRNLEVGIEAETIEECCLTVSLPLPSELCFTKPTDNTAYSGLGPPTSNSYQENAL